MKSLYVIQTQVIGIDHHPFPKPHTLRPVWRQIFCNPRCFTEQRQLIRDASWSFRDTWQTEMGLSKENDDNDDWDDENPSFKLPRPPMPFIRGLGSICFNTRRIHSKTYYERRNLAFELWGQEKENNLEHDDIDEDDDVSSWLLGYDRDIQDQRMNYLCFELARPLSLRAETDSDIRANSKLFIHIYPSGYFVLHLATSLRWKEARSLPAVREILKELRPNHLNTTWTWSSRLEKESESLHSLIRKIYRKIENSIFDSPQSKLRKSDQWRTFLRVTMEHVDPDQVSSALLGSHSAPKIIKDLSPPSSRSGVECLVVTPQGAACIFRPVSVRHEEIRKNYSERLPGLIARIRNQISITSLPAEVLYVINQAILNTELFGLKDRAHSNITYRLKRSVWDLELIPWELREKERNSALAKDEEERLSNLRELDKLINELEYLVTEMHQSWCKPQAARRFFWKMSRIQEFVLVKERIYKDYMHFMQDHIHMLQKWRRSITRKVKEEDIFKFSVFDQQAADHLLILDRHIDQTNNFYRYVYYVFCAGTKIDDYRHKVIALIGEWDKEAQAWEHPLYAVWKRIVQPLRAILK